VLAAISGWLFAHYQRAVNPTPFGLNRGIEYLFMAVLGGVGQVWGAFVGAGAVKLIEDKLQVWLPALTGTNGNYEVIVFGVLIVLLLKYAPDGLWPAVNRWLERWLPLPRRAMDWAQAAHLHVRNRPTPGDVLLQVQSVRKEFGGLVAVNDVSFELRAGEIVGLIGPMVRASPPRSTC
jgi:branched-chain amino acid transport system permease protein